MDNLYEVQLKIEQEYDNIFSYSQSDHFQTEEWEARQRLSDLQETQERLKLMEV